MSSRKISNTALLDTSAFIPLLDPDNPFNERLANHLKQTNALLCIDTIVLSEFLVKDDNGSDLDALADKFTKQFRVFSFDARTAVVCSRIFSILKSRGQVPRAGTARQITKVDIMVVSSAIVNRVDEFIFADNHFKSILQHIPDPLCGFKLPSFISLDDLPPVLVQDDLPRV